MKQHQKKYIVTKNENCIQNEGKSYQDSIDCTKV